MPHPSSSSGPPMAASGFAQLVGQVDDRMLIPYDPRGAERSRLTGDGQVTAQIPAEDLRRIVGQRAWARSTHSGPAAAAPPRRPRTPEALGEVIDARIVDDGDLVTCDTG